MASSVETKFISKVLREHWSLSFPSKKVVSYSQGTKIVDEGSVKVYDLYINYKSGRSTVGITVHASNDELLRKLNNEIIRIFHETTTFKNYENVRYLAVQLSREEANNFTFNVYLVDDKTRLLSDKELSANNIEQVMIEKMSVDSATGSKLKKNFNQNDIPPIISNAYLCSNCLMLTHSEGAIICPNCKHAMTRLEYIYKVTCEHCGEVFIACSMENGRYTIFGEYCMPIGYSCNYCNCTSSRRALSSFDFSGFIQLKPIFPKDNRLRKEILLHLMEIDDLEHEKDLDAEVLKHIWNNTGSGPAPSDYRYVRYSNLKNNMGSLWFQAKFTTDSL